MKDDGERTIKYVPARTDARYSAKNAGSADRFESIIYPNALITAKALDFVEQLEYRKDPKVVNYTKHYYIGSERIASALGTKRGMGAYCATERSAVRDELNDKVTAAGQAIEDVFEYFGKHIQLPPPFVYSDSNGYPCSSTQVPEDYGAYWYHPDHLGSSSYITNLSGEINQHMEYLPFGETLVEEHLNSNNSPYKFNAKEFDAETGNYYYGARYYDPKWSVWLGVDPFFAKFPSYSPYNYTLQNPIKFIDPDGREPIRPLVGTSATFRAILDNSPRKVGSYTGQAAHNYVLSLGNTKFNWKQMRPLPTETGFFNTKKGRYIYTKKGGWIDMTHFMFYAGKAYRYKLDGVKNPIGEAVQDGYQQEFSDKFAAPHSAYSYEDLPSDKYGAEFAVDYFDPESDKSLGEQIQNYLDNVLEATDPKNAPNFEHLPKEDTKDPPTRINKSTKPVYTKENP